MKVWCEIRRTAGDRGDVNVKNVNGDIVEGGCNREVFSDGVIGEEGVGGEPYECDGVMNVVDKSSTNRVPGMAC